MSTIIVQPDGQAHPGSHLDAAAQHRSDRLAMATAEDMEKALAFLSVIDPEAFEIAFTAVRPRADATTEDADQAHDDEEPIPVCRHCGAPAGIFLAHGPGWQHFRGDAATSGRHEIYEPGHPAAVRLAPPRRGPGRPLARKHRPAPRTLRRGAGQPSSSPSAAAPA